MNSVNVFCMLRSQLSDLVNFCLKMLSRVPFSVPTQEVYPMQKFTIKKIAASTSAKITWLVAFTV